MTCKTHPQSQTMTLTRCKFEVVPNPSLAKALTWVKHTTPEVYLRPVFEHEPLLLLRTLRRSSSVKRCSHFRSYVSFKIDNHNPCSREIAALMSNHSAEYPNGILDKETLKSFFSITEASDGTLTWTPGWERIPDNWLLCHAPNAKTQLLTQTSQVPPPARPRQRIQSRQFRDRPLANRRRRPGSRLRGRQYGHHKLLHRRRPRQHHWRSLPDLRPHQPYQIRLLLLPADLGRRAGFLAK